MRMRSVRLADDLDRDFCWFRWTIVAALKCVRNDAGQTDSKQVNCGSHFRLDHGLHCSQLLIVMLCDQLMNLTVNLLLDLLLYLFLDVFLQPWQLGFNVL